MQYPRHVVDAPVIDTSVVLLLLLLVILGQDLLPSFVFLLFDLVVSALFVLDLLTSLVPLVFVIVSICSSCRELGSKLELSFELVDAVSYTHLTLPTKA